MKDYNDSISYLCAEMKKQSKSHQKPYTDAIMALLRLQPTEPVIKPNDPMMYCPHCGKPYTFRSAGDIKHGERVCNNCGQHMKWGHEDKEVIPE